MFKHSLYHKIHEALPTKGCPICILTKSAIDHHLQGFLYERVNDVGIRMELLKSKGFCPRHSWMLQSKGDPLAHAILYQDQIREFLDSMDGQTNPKRTQTHLSKASPCPLCSFQQETETTYLQALCQFLQDPEFALTYSSSHGLCRPHLILGLKLKTTAKDPLISTFKKTAQEFQTTLEALKQSFDYRYSQNDSKENWMDSVAFWVGQKGLF